MCHCHCHCLSNAQKRNQCKTAGVLSQALVDNQKQAKYFSAFRDVCFSNHVFFCEFVDDIFVTVVQLKLLDESGLGFDGLSMSW